MRRARKMLRDAEGLSDGDVEQFIDDIWADEESYNGTMEFEPPNFEKRMF